MKVTNSERIRKFIAAAGRPVTFAEVREAHPDMRVDGVLGSLVYRGLVVAEGAHKRRTYSPGRAPRWKRRPPAEKVEPKAEPPKKAEPRRPPSLAPAPSVLWAPQPAPAPRAETVEEWMQRTGKRPERLEGFAGVKPLPRMPVRSF